MSPAIDWYLDMMQGDVSTEALSCMERRLNNVYAFNILPKGIDSTYVIKAMWTEQIPTTAQVEYMTYPRAISIRIAWENTWSPNQTRTD